MENNLLVLCVYCKRINVSGNGVVATRNGGFLSPDSWLSEKGNKITYNSLMKIYEQKISPGLCSSCLDEQRKELERMKRKD